MVNEEVMLEIQIDVMKTCWNKGELESCEDFQGD